MNVKNTAIKAMLVTGIGAMSVSMPAYSADGCKFMLCMGAANPMGVKECVSTIKDVMRDLRKGRGFPTCSLVDGTDSKASGSYVAHQRANPTPMCPDGYRQGSDNVIYHQGQKPANMRPRSRLSGGALSQKYEGGNRLFNIFGDRYKARACVKGNQNGSVSAYTYTRHNGGDREIVKVPRQEWYDSTMIMTPDGAEYEFTFFVDDKPFSKHRF